MSFYGPIAHIDNDECIITDMQRHKRINPIIILNIFSKYQNTPELMEELKNKISDERDYFDIVDLVLKMELNYRNKILSLFQNNQLPYESAYATKIMADIDNTTLENSCIAPIVYKDKDIIPGIQTILKYFSQGKTTVSFISARPRQLERNSINTINNLISKQLRFSFLTGDIKSIGKWTIGKITFSKSIEEWSYTDMATKKFQNYLALKELYPHCRFIFLGDDTQGDAYFARMVVQHDPRNFAAIRIIAKRELPEYLFNHSKIYYHSSYFELIHRMILLGLIDKDIISPILEFEWSQQYHSYSYQQEQVNIDTYYVNLIQNLHD